MSAFKPLCPAILGANESGTFRAKIVNSDSAVNFSSPSTRAIVATAHIHEALVPEKNASPKVTLRRDGDRITHIQIECGCGQIMDLECTY